jgi:hypothetical protein
MWRTRKTEKWKHFPAQAADQAAEFALKTVSMAEKNYFQFSPSAPHIVRLKGTEIKAPI